MSKDVFDYHDAEDERRLKARQRTLVWNVLTVVALVSALCLACLFLAVFLDPQSGLNPFPPPTMPVLAPTITPSPTLRAILPPTWTPTPTAPPTETPTPEPTYTLTPEGALPTLQEEAAPATGMPFIIQQGSPQYIAASIFRPDIACSGIVIGGQVIGLNNGPVLYLSIKLGGSLGGKSVDLLTISGTTTTYGGQGGYEFVLPEAPANSNQSLYVQLLDQADLPLTEKYYFDTFESCEQNLILINFQQVR